VDLVTTLTADPEWPWAEWKRGKPLTQKQLGRLLRPFGLCYETVCIPGLNDAKGYKRARFEEVWAADGPGQLASRADSDASIDRTGVMLMESVQLDDFRSVAETSGDGSKNGNLSYSHTGSDASTLRKPGNGAQSDSATTETQSDVPGDIPEGLVRTG